MRNNNKIYNGAWIFADGRIEYFTPDKNISTERFLNNVSISLTFYENAKNRQPHETILGLYFQYEK